ncbi:prohead protease/major capsid protein fusion protein [Falsiroseomonas ponticola]|uniref:prohead protease/major capsid protein fusion protein n=1 Tax=Falsiroseomonas ponticola TaxID=2786951 RepID=UPI0019334E7D|nr:prohead protease/major capsid protein fusion protein [Roseomonas ponticola]
MMTADATFGPGTYDPVTGTVVAVLSTPAPVLRYDVLTGERFEEVLPGMGCNLARANAGLVQLLTDHKAVVGSVVGSVVPGSARVEAGRIVATLRFDRSSPEGRAIEAKVAAGHQGGVSVGYRVTAWETIDRKGNVPRREARAWELLEVSFVPVPADAGAGVRTAIPTTPSTTRAAASAPAHQETTVNTTTTQDHGGGSASPEVITRAERHRVREIQTRARALGLDAALADELVESGATIDAASTRFVDALAARTPQAPSGPRVDTRGGADRTTRMAEAMGEALFCRALGGTPSERAAEFMALRIPDMAAELLAAGGVSTRGMAPDQVITRSMHTTSDFPILLINASRRALLDSFVPASSGLRRVMRMRQTNDFRALSVARFAGVDKLDRINEGGEVKQGTGFESAETYRVITYAKLFNLSRQALVNDDLSAFTAVNVMGRAAANTEADTFVELLAANAGAGPTMADGNPLFRTQRGNLAAAGTELNVSTLSLGRTAMRVQRDLNGVVVSNGPRYLVVGPAQETAGEKVLAEISPATVDGVNPFAGKMELVVEPRLTGNQWLLFGDPATSPVLELATLTGTNGQPQVESFVKPEQLGITMRVVHDFGVGAVSPIGAWRNPGQA